MTPTPRRVHPDVLPPVLAADLDAGDAHVLTASDRGRLPILTRRVLVGLLQGQEEVERLLVVGHNPGLERLVALLNSGRSGDYRGMPTAAVAVLALPRQGAFEPGLGRLTAFWWP